MGDMDKDKQGQHGGQGHPDRPHTDKDKDKDKERPGHQAPNQDPGRKPQPGGGQGDRGTQGERR
jgi:hypothetical protein